MGNPRTNASNRYNAKHYKQIATKIPIALEADFRKKLAADGRSYRSFLIDAIQEYMKKETV